MTVGGFGEELLAQPRILIPVLGAAVIAEMINIVGVGSLDVSCWIFRFQMVCLWHLSQ